MRLGIVIPQGWIGEFDRVPPRAAWGRCVDVATTADKLGFDSVWVFDHLQPMVVGTTAITFESFTTISALAVLTSRVRLGHLVLCAGFRNPALVAKMVATLDVISNGRAELGIGAGWKKDEWQAYGYRFPPVRERLSMLEDDLEVISRMLEPGAASFEGRYATIRDAVNEPKGLQIPRIPIIVGGNGPEVTWRLAARFADELNLDSLTPEGVAEALPKIRDRCIEIGRDPASLKVSVHAWWEYLPGPGRERVELLQAYRALGIDRAMLLLPDSAHNSTSLQSLAHDADAAGVEMGSQRDFC